ncbi:E3 ubiquitin-protein ligase RNF103-like [Penaeus japonicus]|uniref:E3 ubiquitin-protein ligase RNF103-like n=1 Tax=Penaeus japonicus TaxID=27405 RepID=UPI001C711B38|nr:E3 ubiquitin-protein ligase RNF103-like [Penaeus japonicus]XP_042864258.1 E3 ubiquitin-protein ligase RNF103-like [Penaeus japonicus]
MWQRPALALLYLAIVVVVTWMVEMVFWWDAGYTSYQIVNPLRNLSVSQLRSLLEIRGIQHTALLEKSEIVNLLQQSGPVQYGELLEKKEDNRKQTPIELSGKDDYHEQVYEENESLWLVEVVPGEGQYTGHRLLDDRSWRILTPRLQALQISSAVISCQFDRRFCARQGWSHPQLVLVLPPRKQGNTQSSWINGQTAGREHIVLASTTHLTVTSVLSWLHSQIQSRIQVIHSLRQLEETWFNTTAVSKEKIPRVVYISELLNPPLLIATLGLRLSTRIKLASFTVKYEEREQVSELLKKKGLNGIPNIAVVTAEGVTSYGKQKGESLTNIALDSYMCTLQPQMNDVFLVSLVLANALAVADIFNVFDVRVRAWKHAIRTLIRMLVYNIFVFVVWLAFTAILKFPLANIFLESGLWVISYLNSTWLFAQLRYHWLMIARHPIIFWMSAHIFGIIVILRRVISRRENEPADMDSNWWSIFSMDSYLVDVLFRPMASLSRPRPSQDLGLEEGMELLIERLATPDLWLHPVIPNDYMKDLPTWRYDGWGNEEDLKSESETDIDSVSDNENDILLDIHACCQDDNCRLCELWTTVKEIYVCHRCAILKRKLERQYLRYRKISDSCLQNITYEKLLKVCENCSKTKKQNAAFNSQQSDTLKDVWLLSPQRLTELKWTAPSYAIESRVCAICLGRYRWSAVLCGLPCGHNYHHSCITEWLLKDNHHCPTCRWPSYKNKPSNTAHEHEE